MSYIEFPNRYETNMSQIPREVILQMFCRCKAASAIMKVHRVRSFQNQRLSKREAVRSLVTMCILYTAI